MAEPTDRRDAILTSAAELFAAKGITATTVREIADRVGMLSGSLYHHFDSKDAMVAEILAGYLGVIRERYAEVVKQNDTPAGRLHGLVLASLEIAEKQPHATAIYQNEVQYLRGQELFAEIQQSAADVQATWLRVIETGVADGTFRRDVPPRTFYRLIRDAAWLSVRWHRPGGDYSTAQLADDVTSTFLDGFSARR